MSTTDKLNEVLNYYPFIKGYHPACMALPDLAADDYDALKQSLKKHGQANELLVTEDGLLIDGRHRLLALDELGLDPRYRTVTTDPWDWVVANNIAHRHMTVGQKAAFADIYRTHHNIEAKKRQTRKPVNSVQENFPEQNGQARDTAAATVGVSGKSVDHIRTVKQHEPELYEQVRSGEMALNKAYTQARKTQKAKDANAAPKETKAAPKETATVDVIDLSGNVTKIPAPKVVKFNQTNDSVDWAKWTWNPVTGCNHGCNFCYAREIANTARMAPYYPNKFEPSFHKYRLDAPANTPVPDSSDSRDGRVFVCSMADLFGKWVPKEWIKMVFDACIASPEWEYLFLTKWPAKYSQLPLIDGAWYGASIVTQADVSRVEKAMAKLPDNCVRWISMEPMLGPIEFSDLSWCDLVVVGAQTATTQPEGKVPAFSPSFDWVFDVVDQCRKAEVPYYLKANMSADPGMELPRMEPRLK